MIVVPKTPAKTEAASTATPASAKVPIPIRYAAAAAAAIVPAAALSPSTENISPSKTGVKTEESSIEVKQEVFSPLPVSAEASTNVSRYPGELHHRLVLFYPKASTPVLIPVGRSRTITCGSTVRTNSATRFFPNSTTTPYSCTFSIRLPTPAANTTSTERSSTTRKTASRSSRRQRKCTRSWICIWIRLPAAYASTWVRATCRDIQSWQWRCLWGICGWCGWSGTKPEKGAGCVGQSYAEL
jgi:hypothetical protein